MKKRSYRALCMAAVMVTALFCTLFSACNTTKNENKEIVISLQTGNGLSASYRAVAEAYMQRNAGVTVTVELKPTANYKEWLKGELTANETRPDIVDISYNADDFSYFADYYEYLNDESPYTAGKLFKEQFNVDAQIPDAYTGKMLSISLERVQVLWVYNKGIFTLSGVEDVPTTWDEFVTACEKISAAGYTPISMEGTYDGFLAGSMGHMFQIYNDQISRDVINTVRAQEGDYCYIPSIDGAWSYDPADPFNDDPGYVTVNPVRLLKAIDEDVYRGDSEGSKFVTEQLARVFPKFSGGDTFFGQNDKVVPFYKGEAAMMMDGAYRIARYYRDYKEQQALIENDPDAEVNIETFDLGTFMMPSMQGAHVKAAARTIEVPVGYMGVIEKNKTKTELCMDFMMFLSSETGYQIFMDTLTGGGYAPSGIPLVYGVSMPDEYAAIYEQLTPIGNCQKPPCQTIARGAPNEIQQSNRDWYNYTQTYFKADKSSGEKAQAALNTWASAHQANIKAHLEDSFKSAGISRNDLTNPQNRPTGV